MVLVIVSAVLTKPVSSGTFPGTNGKIAFIAHRDGNNEIYVMDADGSNQTRITNNSSLYPNDDFAWNLYSRSHIRFFGLNACTFASNTERKNDNTNDRKKKYLRNFHREI